MCDNPLISVIVPVYNTERFLNDCMESILQSTYTNLEIICINDASTDGSLDMLQRFAALDSRIILIDCPEHVGVSAARNLGLERMRGAYVAFVDSDDAIEPEMFERLLDKMTRENSDVVVCGFAKFYSLRFAQKSARIVSLSCSSPIGEKEFWEMYRYPQNTCVNAIWNKLYRAERFNGVRFREGIVFEDLEIQQRLLSGVGRISVLQEPLYRWRTRSGSVTHSRVTSGWYPLAEVHAERARYLASRGWKKACAQALSFGAVYLTQIYLMTREDLPRYKACRKALLREFRLPMLLSMTFRNAAFFILFALHLDIPTGWLFLHFVRRFI